MGGKLLNTSRIPKSKYFELIKELESHFTKTYPKLKYHFPRSLPSKQDYGDVDILLFTNQLEDRINPKQDAVFNAHETIIHSGNMESFVYKQTQIDLIWFQEEIEFEMARVWYDFGDLSMLLGVLWKRLGCKFTNKGLFLKHHSILLSQTPSQIYSFLGLDFTKWKEGFKDEKDLAQWISTSKFFHPSFYDVNRFLKEGNQGERRRSTKRPMQIKVMELLSNMPPKLQSIENLHLEKECLSEILKCFDKNEEYELLEAKESQRAMFKECFNGKFVSELTGLVQKELGAFMLGLKTGYTDEQFQTHILDLNDAGGLKRYILDKFANW